MLKQNKGKTQVLRNLLLIGATFSFLASLFLTLYPVKVLTTDYGNRIDAHVLCIEKSGVSRLGFAVPEMLINGYRQEESIGDIEWSRDKEYNDTLRDDFFDSYDSV